MVDRAVAELRRGDAVMMRPDRGPALLIHAAELADRTTMDRIARLTGHRPMLIVTGQRAVSLGIWSDPTGVAVVAGGADEDPEAILDLVDPARVLTTHHRARPVPAELLSGALAACRLLKLARLLPAVLASPVERPVPAERIAGQADLFSVSAQAVDAYDAMVAEDLRIVSEARVPLKDVEDARLFAFRPADGGREHLAIVVGEPSDPALVRLHSECFTGDLLGSLRCDCGDQLRGAIAEMARAGAGVLLYLSQEGRGIGLANKLRAYALQDQEFDTVDANEMLGYDADERVYRPAARMLGLLGIHRVRLMTNNPEKVRDLVRHGIEVTERVPHVFSSNGHNEFYLRTKRERSGHLL
ncbi:MAG: GTP cyclohydrolase II [Rhodospirillaceae bacterium]|nr:GTP cyclohydrolase II [Rhodospirillaceae bacterium]